MDEKLTKAKKVFATLCAALDSIDWHYDKDEDDLTIESGARGDDLPMDVNFKINSERQISILFSKLPYKIEESQRLALALAVAKVNNAMVDGFFDYDITTGNIYFKLTSSFVDCEVSEELFLYMLRLSLAMIDEYNDKFLMLSKGVISITDFLNS